ncbi:MAG: hypothetical protein HN491_12260 [Rhodospirillales bacterium]|jgi:hypothetical protein|nr:hypothetical protein [Rhodospirillales bacterium]
MTAVHEDFSDHPAPPGHVTFSVLDQEHSGHSVSVASNEYQGVVRTAKSTLSCFSAATVFEEAIKIILRSVSCSGDGCQCEDDGLLTAFISALLKHPDKCTRKKLMEGINGSLKKNNGAHVILIMPSSGPSAWLIADPSDNGKT